MLVLTRKVDQAIRVGDVRIVITKVDAKSGQVRVGVEAPPDVPIVRDELRPLPAAGDEPLPARTITDADMAELTVRTAKIVRAGGDPRQALRDFFDGTDRVPAPGDAGQVIRRSVRSGD